MEKESNFAGTYFFGYGYERGQFLDSVFDVVVMIEEEHQSSLSREPATVTAKYPQAFTNNIVHCNAQRIEITGDSRNDLAARHEKDLDVSEQSTMSVPGIFNSFQVRVNVSRQRTWFRDPSTPLPIGMLLQELR